MPARPSPARTLSGLSAAGLVLLLPVAASAAGVPSAPGGVTATAKDGAAVLGWSAPSSTGGSPITGYTATCTAPSGAARTAQAGKGARSASVSGLVNGTAYACRVRAGSSAGQGAESAPVRVVPVGPPSAPRAATITTRAGALTVAWKPPVSGATTVTGYAVACSSTDGGPALSATPGAGARSVTLTGLPDNRTYRCAVTASSSRGSSGAATTAYAMHAVAEPGGRAEMHLPVTATQSTSVVASGLTFPSGCVSRITVAAPGGRETGYGCMGSDHTSYVDGAAVLTAGTATATLQAAAGESGTAELVAHVFTDLTGTTAIGGPAVPLAFTAPGQNALLTFAGSAGQRVALTAASTTMDGYTYYRVLDAGGATVFYGTVPYGSQSTWSDVQVLPAAGTYRVVVDPQQQSRGEQSIRVAAVAADHTGPLAVGGPARALRFSAGQNAALTFSGAAGQRVELVATSTTMSGYSRYQVDQPGGSSVAYGTVPYGAGSVSSGPITLPVSGTYTVRVDPLDLAAGAMSLRVTTS